MPNKSALLTLGSACVLLLLAACGGSSSGGGDDTQAAVDPGTVPPTTPTTPEAPGTPVTNPPIVETPVTPPVDTGTDPLFLNADSGLSHPGQAIPKGTATTSLGDSFLSNVGRSKVCLLYTSPSPRDRG